MEIRTVRASGPGKPRFGCVKTSFPRVKTRLFRAEGGQKTSFSRLNPRFSRPPTVAKTSFIQNLLWLKALASGPRRDSRRAQSRSNADFSLFCAPVPQVALKSEVYPGPARRQSPRKARFPRCWKTHSSATVTGEKTRKPNHKTRFIRSLGETLFVSKRRFPGSKRGLSGAPGKRY
jgi:hypothetical protein